METTALLTRPLAPPDRAGAGGRITPRQNFRALNLLLVVTPRRPPNAGSRSVSGVACAVLIRTVCADSARVACALFSLPAPDQRKCRRRTTGLLTRSARGGGQTAPACAASVFVTPEQHRWHLRAERLRGLQLITSSNLTTGTRPPLAHHWLTVDFTDETGNGCQEKGTARVWSRFPEAINDTALGRHSPQLVPIPH